MDNLKWEWDGGEIGLVAMSIYYDEGSQFYYLIKQNKFGVFTLSGTPELVPKEKKFHRLSGAIRHAQRIEDQDG